jgi:hypothetical protein
MSAKRLFFIILPMAGIITGLVFAALVRDQFNNTVPPAYRPLPAAAAPSPVQPIDHQAVRERAWGKIEPLLAQAEQAGVAALDRHLATIPAFITERKQGTRAFSARLLGLRGKWELIKTRFRTEGEDEYARWLRDQFADNLFRSEELQQTVEAAIRAYLSELVGIEGQLLIRLRADLADSELQVQEAIPALWSDAVLRQRYDMMMTLTLPLLDKDLKVTAVREAASFVGSEIATAITLKVGAAVMARLGVSAGILTTGAASGWATFGIGLVIGFVVDQAIGEIMKAAGYDAEARIAARVDETLDDIGRVITDGDPEARTTLAKLQRMHLEDPDEEVRAACPSAIRLINENSCRLRGLRGELSKINAARASLRKEALSRLVHNPEVTTP